MAGIDAENARKAWEIENEIETLPASDEIFRYDAQEQQQFLGARKYTEPSFANWFSLFVSTMMLTERNTVCFVSNS